MTYIITSLCLRDSGCVEVCPVECIVPGKPVEEWPWYYIDPDTCIDCGACVPECPFEAIFVEDEVPDAYEAKGGEQVSMPKGTERYNNPIMVDEYVNLTAPFERRGELIETVGSAPDSLSAIEDYVRRDFGDEAANVFRREEVAARIKEKEMLIGFRQRYGELDDEILQSEPEKDVGDAHEKYI